MSASATQGGHKNSTQVNGLQSTSNFSKKMVHTSLSKVSHPDTLAATLITTISAQFHKITYKIYIAKILNTTGSTF